MSSIKLVACDMDGTFLRSDRTPHPDNIAAVKSLIESGVTFCLASGRGIGTMRSLLAELSLAGPAVSSNGAYVIGIDGSDVSNESLTAEVIENLVGYAEKNRLHLNHYYGDTITFSGDGPYADLYRERTGCEPNIAPFAKIRTLPATKLLFVGSHKEIAVHANYFGRYTGLEGTTVVSSEPDYLEFLPAGITKGIGLQRLADFLGIPSSQCAAIGDWLNDLEMLQWAGHSACVANAHPEIQAVSKTKVGTNDDAGVAEFINSIIASNKAGIVSA